MERTRTHKGTEAARRGALIWNGKITAGAALAALAVLFTTLTACPTGVTPPQSATGRITVNFSIEGIPLARTGARTVYPAGIASAFTKYELTFAATSGGANQGPTVVSGSSESIELAVGTYTITATAFTGSNPSYTAVAEGSVAGVVVTAGSNTGASITLGPKTGGANGTFSYDITVPAGTTSATLTITKLDTTVVGSPVTLTSGQNANAIPLAPGYYYVRVSLTKDSEEAGLTETIHIYTGLTSALPAKTYTAADFAVLVAVSDLALESLFDAPAAGVAPDTTLTGDEYTGTIAWAPTVSGVFAGTTTYTATVTLTAKPGYTFEGVAANAFSYAGAASAANTADSGVVTIVFPATGNVMGSQNVSWALIDYSDIPVTGYTATPTLTQGGATLTLSVTGYDNVAWHVDGNSTAAETGDSITLDGDDYSVKPHSLTVQATKNGIPFARVLAFTVEAAAGGGGGGGGVALADLTAYIADLAANTAETPHTVVLAAGTYDDYFSTTNIETLKTALAQNRYIVLDISGVTSFPNAISGSASPASSDFNYFANSYIVEVVLPSTIVSISYDSFYGVGLKKITIPVSVTSISGYSFDTCSALAEVTFLSASVSMESNSFQGDLKTPYESGGAGTYVKSSGTWSKQP
jgi:hypothetical protein